MSDREALLRAVCDSPDDDAPRLVFADWLEEQGEPERAEFIRVQCELARLKVDDDYRRGRTKRSIALLQEFGQQWLAADWPEAIGQTVDAYTFERGFVAILVTAYRFLHAGDAIVMVQARPLLSLVRSWNLSGASIPDAVLWAMAGSPYVRQLQTLLLTGNPVTESGLSALAASPSLASLQELHVGVTTALPLRAQPRTFMTLDRDRIARVAALFRRHGKQVTVKP